jgi:ribonuclease R
VIRSAERMTYTNVHLLLEGDAAMRERYQPLVARFELMQELALVLNRKRVRRGSIDFDLPEPLIEFDEWGAMTGVTRAPRNIANRIIEEFMLAANEAWPAPGACRHRLHLPHPREARPQARDGVRGSRHAFRLLAGHRRHPGEALRHHRPASRRQQEAPRSRGGRFGDEHLLAPLPAAGGQDRRQARGAHPQLPDAALAAQARYSTENVGHFALAAETYTHFTSPIRRYPDLMVHRLLRAVLTGKPTPGEEYLKPLAEECSQSERRAADAERELVEWKKVKFMTDRVGEDFDALIISTAKYGLFVELADLFIEGLVPIDTLPGDEYTYQENVRKMVGKRTRREFSIGDRCG